MTRESDSEKPPGFQKNPGRFNILKKASL